MLPDPECMRHVLLALIAALAIAAAFAGAGFGGTGHHPAPGTDLGGFGGPVGHTVKVAPIWHEGAAPPAPPLRRVPCATAVLGDTSLCYEPSTSS